MMSGSTCALKSSSREISNSLVAVMSCLPASAVSLVFCSMLFVFIFFHNCFQLVEPLFPHPAERLDKIGYFFHIFCIYVIVDLPAAGYLFQQFAFGEYRQMFGDGGPGRVEIGGYGTGGHGLRSEQEEDGSPGRVCYGLENVAS